MAWLHFQHFYVGHELLQLAGSAGQLREGAEVHGDYGFGLEEFAGIGGLARRHGEMVADGQHDDFGRVEIADDSHVAEDVGVAGVVELDSVGELEHVAAGFAAVDDLVAILNAAGVDGVDHGDLHVGDGLRAALIHGRDLFDTFFLEPEAEFEDADGGGVVLFAYIDGVSDVVAVAVSADEDVGALDVLIGVGALGIAGDPGIDVERLAFGRLDAEGGVA